MRHCYCYCYCPVLLLLLLMLGCRQPTYTRAHTRTHRENTSHSLSLSPSLRQTKLLELSVCLSSFPHKSTFAVDADLHAMTICAALVFTRNFFRFGAFQIFVFVFVAQRVDCAIRAITLTLRIEVNALARSFALAVNSAQPELTCSTSSQPRSTLSHALSLCLSL